MNTMDLTAAYITTVDANRTIHLPSSVPNGATVAVIVMPSAWRDDEQARQFHFSAALEEIHRVNTSEAPTPSLSDQEINQLVRKLRKQMPST
jgi:hypothetical protein